MIDLSKGPILLRAATPAELRDALAREMPKTVGVKLVEGRLSAIELREGLWRGMTLTLQPAEKGLTLAGYRYEIPTFGSKVLLFALSVALFSVILMVSVAVVVGEFVPMIGGVGGLAGFAMYSAVETLTVRNVRRGWSPVTERAIANVTA